jgi:hypothetical protein
MIEQIFGKLLTEGGLIAALEFVAIIGLIKLYSNERAEKLQIIENNTKEVQSRLEVIGRLTEAIYDLNGSIKTLLGRSER